MGRISGIEAARQLRKMGLQTKIVFLSSSKDYVFDALDFTPVHYLVKGDTSESKFEDVFLLAASPAQNTPVKTFTCKVDASRRVLPMDEISHFEISKGQVAIHYGKSEQIKCWMTMGELERQLRDTDFRRTHRSYVVNLLHIANFQRRALILKDGTPIPIVGTYSQKVKEAFSEFIATRSVSIGA